MKINADLDSYETEALFDILQREINKHKIESKLSYLSKEMSAAEFQWSQYHAEFLEKIKAKLITPSK